MAKPKPDDEKLEDEVWCILAQMGFKELSQGRQFKIAVQEGLEPRQIDVFAKDDDSVVIVECTRNPHLAKNMSNLIDKIKAFRESLHRSIHNHYGRDSKLKVKYAIATRNIAWSEADIAKCTEAQISIISDTELDYYVELVKQLKQASRYQFLSHMFEGQKIDGLAQKVFATKGRVRDTNFYTFLIKPEHLLKISYVGHKGSQDINNIDTYQRMLKTKRLNAIAAYINKGGKFPTNIVINLKTKNKNNNRSLNL